MCVPFRIGYQTNDIEFINVFEPFVAPAGQRVEKFPRNRWASTPESWVGAASGSMGVASINDRLLHSIAEIILCRTVRLLKHQHRR
jgi:hypothetical protein